MSEQRKADLVEKLVADYLEAGGATVDGRAILDRVQRTRRRRQIRRWYALPAAAAAIIAVAIVGFVVMRPEGRTPPTTHRIAQAARAQGRNALSGWQTIADSAVSSLDSAASGMIETIPAQPTPDLSDAVAGATETLLADAKHVGGKLKSLFSGSLRKTGLLI